MPSAIRQWTRNGSVITSRRKPSPRHDTIALNAVGCGMMSVNSISMMIAGLGILDAPERPARFWVHRARIERREIGDRRRRGDLPVERVAGLERDLLALADFKGRSKIGMPAVMPAMRLPGERFSAVDADRVHGLALRAAAPSSDRLS